MATGEGVRCESCNKRLGDDVAGVYLNTCPRCRCPVMIVGRLGTRRLVVRGATYLVTVTREQPPVTTASGTSPT